MLNNITIGRYYNTNSKIHLLNPLSKLICTIIFITTVLINQNVYLNILFFVVLLFLMILSNIPLKIYFKNIKSISWLLISIFIINLIFKLPILENINLILRIILTLLYSIMLTLTTTPFQLIRSLEILFYPLKLIGIPVKKIAFSLVLAIKFIPMLIDEANLIIISLATRGMDYKLVNTMGKIRILKNILMPLLTITVKKADNLAVSMELRLFNFKNKRTNIGMNKWTTFDSFMILFHFVLLLLVVKGGTNEILNYI